MSAFDAASRVRVVIPRRALNAIFDECDRYDQDETGGRVLGTYDQDDGKLTIRVGAILDPGPTARRTSTSFFQDGEYQERAFREIEGRHPEIEHLGSWHTHHVNGFPTLSGGDIETYQRTVNHPKHNTTFFYALLVVAKRESPRAESRYEVKHYVLRRGDRRVYEIRPSHVELTDTPLLWSRSEFRAAGSGAEHSASSSQSPASAPAVSEPRLERVYDKEILGDVHPEVRPYSSPRLGLYWRGAITLIDGSTVEVVAVESPSQTGARYRVTLRNAPSPLGDVADRIEKQDFPSARSAIFVTERMCNRALYDQLRTPAHEPAPKEK